LYIDIFMCKRDIKGFTIVELLVVILLLGLLVSMVVAGYSRALVSGRRTVCAANMRQIGAATLLYAGEHHGYLPSSRHSSIEQEAWIYTLAPYLGNVDEVRISPADPNGTERLLRRGSSYILNDIVVDPATDPFGNPLPNGYGRLSLIPNPSATLLAVVISDDRGTGAANDHTHSRTWTSFRRVLADVEVDRHRIGDRSMDRLSGDAPYLQVDGSVRVHEAATIRELIESGMNIAQPGNAPRR
jgi:prepilin-type N-terminal cleavage/methylation domain-containing protein